MRRAWFQLCFEKIVPQMERVPEPRGLEQYEYPQQLQHLLIPFSALFAESLDSFRSIYLEEGLRNGDRRVADLSRAMEAAVGPWLELLNAPRPQFITYGGL